MLYGTAFQGTTFLEGVSFHEERENAAIPFCVGGTVAGTRCVFEGTKGGTAFLFAISPKFTKHFFFYERLYFNSCLQGTGKVSDR